MSETHDTEPGTSAVDSLDPEPGVEPYEAEYASLFDGDQGTLERPVRNALVTILKTQYISRATHPNEWSVLTAERPTLLSRLHDLLIDLRIDMHTQTAFKVPAPVDVDTIEPDASGTESDAEAERLIRVQPWPVLQAGMLVSLREHYHQERGMDYAATVLVDTDELVAMGARYVPTDHRDERNARSKINAAIDALRTMRILLKVRGVDDRYRVSPVVETLLPLDEIRRLTAEWSVDGPQPGADHQGEAPADDSVLGDPHEGSVLT